MSASFLITGGSDHLIKMWDAQTARCLNTVKFTDRNHSPANLMLGQVNVVRLSGDNKYVFAGGNPLVKIYDTNKGLTYRGQLTHTKNVTDIGLIPQANSSTLTFTSAEDNKVRLWDIRTSLAAIAELPHMNPVNAAAVTTLSSGPVIVSGTQDGKLYAWDVQSRKKLYEATMFDGRSIGVGVRSVGAHGPYVVFANSFGDLYINKMGPKGFEHVLGIRAHSESIMRIRIQKDKESTSSKVPGSSAAPNGGTSGSNRFSSNMDMKDLQGSNLHSAVNSKSNFLPNPSNIQKDEITQRMKRMGNLDDKGKIFSNNECNYDPKLQDEKYMKTGNDEDIQQDEGEIDKDNSFVFVTSSLDGTGCVWNFNGRKLEKLSTVYHKGCVWDGCISRDGRTLVTCSSDRTALLSKGSVQRRFDHELPIHSVAFSEE